MAKMEIPIHIDGLEIIEQLKKEGKLVAVVRCKDCKYYKPMQELNGDGNVTFTYDNGACTRGRECHREWEAVTGEDYCSKGERKEDNGKTG